VFAAEATGEQGTATQTQIWNWQILYSLFTISRRIKRLMSTLYFRRVLGSPRTCTCTVGRIHRLPDFGTWKWKLASTRKGSLTLGRNQTLMQSSVRLTLSHLDRTSILKIWQVGWKVRSSYSRFMSPCAPNWRLGS